MNLYNEQPLSMKQIEERVTKDADDMAFLIKEVTGEDISPAALVKVIRTEWNYLSRLAHRIHDDTRK